MKYRQLGNTDLIISEIGFGAWGIGGSNNDDIAYGKTDDQVSIETLRYALDRGVTFYDTSDFYGGGKSETLIGQAFKSNRRDVILATKGGMVNAQGGRFIDRKYIEESLYSSLQRLRTDYIDLYQLHSPTLKSLDQNPETFEFLESAKKQGLIREYGISLESPTQGFEAIQKYDFAVIQTNFNLIDQRSLDSGLLQYCHDSNVGVISRTPLNFGFLTGKYSNSDQFSSLDHRSHWSERQRSIWSNAYKLFSEIKESQKQSDIDFALRFCLSFPQISTVIPGMLTKGHVDDNILASQLGELSENTLNQIKVIYQANNFFVS